MSDICSKHGPYSVLCKMCDFEAPTPPDADARLREILADAAEKNGAHGIARDLRADEITGGWPLIALDAMRTAALLSAIPGEATEEDVRAVFAKLGLVSAATLTDVLRQHGLIITRAPKETK